MVSVYIVRVCAFILRRGHWQYRSLLDFFPKLVDVACVAFYKKRTGFSI